MKSLAATSVIIHAFALLHAGASVLLLSRGSSDEALLTLLTMSMIVLLCHQKNLGIRLTILCVVIGNIIGYFVGLGGAEIIKEWRLPGSLSNAISTFLTTEFLGWMLYFIPDFIVSTGSKDESHDISPLWLLLMFLIVFGVRLTLIETFDGDLYSVINITDMSMHFLTNSLAMLTMLCGDILVVSIAMNSSVSMRGIMRGLAVMASTLGFAAIGAVIAAFNFPFGHSAPVSAGDVFHYFLVGTVMQIILVVLVVLVNGSLQARRMAHDERNKAHLAQYKYLKLKNQVNPHFLFNNLNVLDYLVSENKNAKASTYIHKLAGIYRYMIRNEDETTVSLAEEMNFVSLYIDLMKVRFPEGLIITTDIPQEDLNSRVIPCCVQLLIENATKHNIVSPEDPLKIHIRSREGNITVTNTLNLKKSSTRPTSTGLGLKYIQEQYEDLAGQTVLIDSHAISDGRDAYQVTIPLL